jgi:hypothetical protein
MIFEFNNKIDPESAKKRENYEVMVGKNRAKVLDIKVKSRMLFLKLKDDDSIVSKDSSFVNIKNLKDIDGNILNKRKTIELYQYRELFVQEYNRPIPFKDSCYLQYLPLEKNCVSKYSGEYNYWMNTPENIKIDK